jgi:hypothetical protein
MPLIAENCRRHVDPTVYGLASVNFCILLTLHVNEVELRARPPELVYSHMLTDTCTDSYIRVVTSSDYFPWNHVEPLYLKKLNLITAIHYTMALDL